MTIHSKRSPHHQEDCVKACHLRQGFIYESVDNKDLILYTDLGWCVILYSTRFRHGLSYKVREVDSHFRIYQGEVTLRNLDL